MIYNNFLQVYKEFEYDSEDDLFIMLDRIMLAFPLVAANTNINDMDYHVTQEMESDLIIPSSTDKYLKSMENYTDQYLKQLLFL